MIRRHLFTLLTAFTLLSSYSFAQTTPPATNKKFNVYKIDINPNGVKDGIRGIAVLFSCEYNFSDPEYAGMRDKEGKTNFTFYASLTDKNNEPAYYASNYSFYRKLNQTTALHFATENAYAPQNKAQGRRNTGIELFIPYTHTTLPEGANAVKFSLNALAEKGKRFDNIYTQNLTINRPAAYAATLVPRQITVIDKGGKRHEAGRLEQDLFVYPGSNKASADVSAMNNVDLNQPVGFLYSEGDVLRLKLQKSTATGVVRSNKPRLLRTSDNKSMATFDNGGAIPGEWPLDPKSGKTVQLKNNGVDLKLELTQYRVPAVQLSGVAINPHATYEGTTGTAVTFTTQANVAAALPPRSLDCLPARQRRVADVPAKRQGDRRQGQGRQHRRRGARPHGHGQGYRVLPFLQPAAQRRGHPAEPAQAGDGADPLAGQPGRHCAKNCPPGPAGQCDQGNHGDAGGPGEGYGGEQ